MAAAASAQNTNGAQKKEKKGFDDQVLNEIQITGTKSTMKLKVDRKEFDVSSMIGNAGQSASEVLENIPSVEVDNDGNISLRGNSSVEVWINGRASGLTSDNRAQILQQLPAESIEKIEIIDNPSAKFSAEGSAGIINIVLKKNRKAGYYGSLQAGADTRGGANTSFNINYNSSKVDAYFNVGYRHREQTGKNQSDQDNLVGGQKTTYERHNTTSTNRGNNLFSRAGLTWHLTENDDLGVSGMFMTGKGKNYSSTPYYYGTYTAAGEVMNRIQQRDNYSGGPMNMYNVDFNYRHCFGQPSRYLDFVVSHMQWKADNENTYQDRIEFFPEGTTPATSSFMSRPLDIHNNNTEIKLDYENPINDKVRLQAGYNGRFSKEHTPQESYIADNWEGTNLTLDEKYFNDFTYRNNIHALYATMSYSFEKLSVMAGLRGEYWNVNALSLSWDQAQGKVAKPEPFKKDYFQLFPSLFMSYQMTASQQLQLNYTRRLRRPWGGELNDFRNTSDASIVSFGNPQLTPEFSNSFSVNYLKSWDQHSLLVSAYYRPTMDVIQRIRYRGLDGVMYTTPENVAKSTSTGLEITGKNKLWRILDITTNVNAYYYKLDAFSYDIEGQTVTGKADDNFTWNARIIASILLPWDISIQTSGRYSSRQVVTQGYRPASYGMDFGIKKNFLNKALVLSINCRDVFNTRQWETYTETESFTRYQLNKRGSRKVNFTLTWNFGNQSLKKRRPDQQNDEDEGASMGGYDM